MQNRIMIMIQLSTAQHRVALRAHYFLVYLSTYAPSQHFALSLQTAISSVIKQTIMYIAIRNVKGAGTYIAR